MVGNRLTIAGRLGFRCILLSVSLAAAAALTGCVVEVGQPEDEDTSVYESELVDPGAIGDPAPGANPFADPGGNAGEPEPTPWRATSDDSNSAGPTPPPSTKTVAPAPKGGADEQ